MKINNAFCTSGSSPTQFEPLLSDEQVGELLFLHPKTVQRMARLGEIPAVRVGRYWRFRTSSLVRWIAAQETGVVNSDRQVPTRVVKQGGKQ
jgi:excisionase family DNA binding protein